ncbi:CD209 antigen-like protein C [Embiotoca jacksoni]|uniref:CD209 antigen-like protein C n=1 Tax=Embiotoca jacksoni TaxID=100190 RepID=UPI0037038C49
MAGVAVAVVTVAVVAGLLLAFVSFAPAADPTSETPDEKLQRCREERHRLDLMLLGVTGGDSPNILRTGAFPGEICGGVFFFIGLYFRPPPADSRCRLCPAGWRWWRRRCYFFSPGLQENRRWNESAEFCRRHDGRLAVIEDSAEMDFLQGVMSTFSRFPFLWVGLTDAQQEGRWLWGDGTDVQHYMPVRVDWDADHRDCADLRGGGSLFAADCDAYGPWICKKES